MLSDEFKGNVNILMFSETEINGNFPICKFEIDRFNAPFRLVTDQKAGAIMLHVGEYLPAKFLSIHRMNDSLFVELKIEVHKVINNLLM